MAPINQIPRLSKIPQLLNRKREADKESKKKEKEESPETFPPEDSAIFEQKKKRKSIAKIKKPTTEKGKDIKVGSKLDIKI